MKDEYYKSQFEGNKKNWKPFLHYLGQTTDETIFISPTNPADIESLINCTKPNKAIGPNSIPTKNIKRIHSWTFSTND